MQRVSDVQVEQVTDGMAVAVLLGEHDRATSDRVRATLTSLAESNEIVVADLSQTEFIDSSILHVLVEADRRARERGGVFRLQLGTAPIVRAAIEITSLHELLDCRPTREDALEPPAA